MVYIVIANRIEALKTYSGMARKHHRTSTVVGHPEPQGTDCSYNISFLHGHYDVGGNKIHQTRFVLNIYHSWWG